LLPEAGHNQRSSSALPPQKEAQAELLYLDADEDHLDGNGQMSTLIEK